MSPQQPVAQYPADGLVVCCPPAFTWVPGHGTESMYLIVSTKQDMSQVDVVNYKDDGNHYYRGSYSKFRALKGRKLYWRLAIDGGGQRIWTPTRSFKVGETSIDPFYVSEQVSERVWSVDNPGTITTDYLEELKSAYGSQGNIADGMLGFQFSIPYFRRTSNIGHYKNVLTRVLAAAKKARLPVLLSLDGFELWDGRPDLWNWWDENAPGFNPANRMNVEWTSWDSTDAVRTSLRNWGSLHSTGTPHPNLASPDVVGANREALKSLAPLIAQWHRDLGSEEKHLLAGVVVGWEVSIGVNYFVPTPPADTARSWEYGRQLGYAAVKTAGIRTSGSLTSADLTEAVRQYLRALCNVVYDAGVPRNKIYTHVGVNRDPSGRLKSAEAPAAVNPYSLPGWSFYTGAAGPQGVLSLNAALDQIAGQGWGNIEWGSPEGGGAVLASFYGHRNNKLSNAWVKSVDRGRAAQFRQVMNAIPFWMHPPILKAEVQGRSVKIEWSAPGEAEKLYLNVTTKPKLNLAGGFVEVDVVNSNVTGLNERLLVGLGSGQYYCKLFSDSKGRRCESNLVAFRVS